MNDSIKSSSKIRTIGWLIVMCLTAVLPRVPTAKAEPAPRKQYVAIVPSSAPWVRNGSLYWTECGLSNPSAYAQNVKFTVMTANNPENGTAVQTTPLNFTFTLQPNASYNQYFSVTPSADGASVPTMAIFEVSGDGRGFLVGACTVYWSTASGGTFNSLPVNSGKPF